MIFRTSKEEIARYWETEALNQSSLKKLLGGVDGFFEETPSNTPYFTIGSAVDTILTGYEGQFEEEFYISSVPKPTEAIEQILQLVYNNSTDKKAGLASQEALIEEAIIANNYQPRWKMETKVAKVLEHLAYYEEIQNMEGKKILDTESMMLVDDIVAELLSSPVSSELFKNTTAHNVDIYYQLPLYWKEDGIDCKGLLDIVVVTKNEDDIATDVVIFDLKTMSDKTTRFLNNFKKFRYDIQAAWYSRGLFSAEEIPFKIDEDITYSSFSFIVACTNYPIQPLRFDVSEKTMHIALMGREDVILDNAVVRYGVKGLKDLLDTYKFHMENGWNIDKEIAESDGVFILDWDNCFYKQVDKNGTEVWKKL